MGNLNAMQPAGGVGPNGDGGATVTEAPNPMQKLIDNKLIYGQLMDVDEPPSAQEAELAATSTEGERHG